jgi:hypothetical protein
MIGLLFDPRGVDNPAPSVMATLHGRYARMDFREG